MKISRYALKNVSSSLKTESRKKGIEIARKLMLNSLHLDHMNTLTN